MPRKQLNVRLDGLTIEAIKWIAQEHNMSESQVITRAVILLKQDLRHANVKDEQPQQATQA